MEEILADLRFRYIDTNGIRLHVAEAGPEDGPLVILLHGFPEFWYGWRKQIPTLAYAGYRVLVPDQRGYNLSDKPRGVEAYRIEELTADVVGLIDASGYQSAAAVIGHDWGGLVAWPLALQYPDRFERLGILNAPHPIVAERLLRSPAQLAKSAYIFFFQLPRIPEALLSADDWRVASQLLVRSSQPDAFSEEELVRYRQAWEQVGAIEAMVNWYRAALRHRPRRSPRRVADQKVQVPTEIVWGVEDQVLGPRMARQSLRFCEDVNLTLLPATHWVQHESPELVTERLLSLLAVSTISDG